MEKNYILKDGVLYHYGTKGQKWGKRNYQNYDGSLTPEGKIRYGLGKVKKFVDTYNSVAEKYKNVTNKFNTLTNKINAVANKASSACNKVGNSVSKACSNFTNSGKKYISDLKEDISTISASNKEYCDTISAFDTKDEMNNIYDYEAKTKIGFAYAKLVTNGEYNYTTVGSRRAMRRVLQEYIDAQEKAYLEELEKAEEELRKRKQKEKDKKEKDKKYEKEIASYGSGKKIAQFNKGLLFKKG